MTVSIAPFSGFCFGVERALELVRKACSSTCSSKRRVVTFGPIIHNPQVVAALEKEGVKELSDIDDVRREDTVVIRTHGVEKSVAEALFERAGKVVDATCPFVSKTHQLAEKLSEGCSLVVVGDAGHPEVKGTVSHAAGEHFIAATPEEAAELPYRDAYGVLAQTTLNKMLFERVIDVIKERCRVLTAKNTICVATDKRQRAALKLAREVDIMLVLGGRNSANTARLCELCRKVCPRSYHVETQDDISDDCLTAERVGITAGASTPVEFVNEVKENILRKKNG
jgi:4-hydroxy-3-methylbut-2-enyl diphosphate reductase